MKLNLGCGPHKLDGFVNLDKQDGWTFEDGLPHYEDWSVEAITVSHSLMYVPLAYWADVFRELARVLEPEGILRVTEDATDDRRSPRYGGFPDAITLTSVSLVAQYMTLVGLRPERMTAQTTLWEDGSLMQNWHGGEPKCFFIEGFKP